MLKEDCFHKVSVRPLWPFKIQTIEASGITPASPLLRMKHRGAHPNRSAAPRAGHGHGWGLRHSEIEVQQSGAPLRNAKFIAVTSKTKKHILKARGGIHWQEDVSPLWCGTTNNHHHLPPCPGSTPAPEQSTSICRIMYFMYFIYFISVPTKEFCWPCLFSSELEF